MRWPQRTSTGFIHRDLKPENIMVTPTGDTYRQLKILDFGLAKSASQALTGGEPATTETIPNLQHGSVLAGTMAYMAPEQLQGDGADARSDIYAVGAVLFEIAAGIHPFRGGTASSTIANVLRQETPSLLGLNPSMPPEFCRIVSKCLRKSRIERYQSARELVTDLANLRKDPLAASNASQKQPTHPSLFHRLISFTGNSPFRQWEIFHIRICIKCLLLLFLTWLFFRNAPGTLGLILSLSEVIASTAVYGLVAVILYTGATDRTNLGREIRRLGLWIRSAAVVSGALAWAMAVTIAVSQPVLAALLLILGANVIGAILLFKPALDRAAVSGAIPD
jgi:serine/threonine protein kinase